MAPAWTALAEHYDKDDGVTIAKMDGTANEVEGFEIKGYVVPFATYAVRTVRCIVVGRDRGPCPSVWICYHCCHRTEHTISLSAPLCLCLFFFACF